MKTKILRWIWKAMLWFFGLSILSVILFKWVPIPFTPLMVTRIIEFKLEGKDAIYSHKWVPLEDISPNLQKAVIASEDGNFLKHNGFDFEAMQKAFKNNSKGRKLKGGSTISQQTAKNVFLVPIFAHYYNYVQLHQNFLLKFLEEFQEIPFCMIN